MLNNNTGKTELSYFVDALFCLLALVVMSVFYYGYRVLIVTSLSVVVCYATDFLCSYLRNKKYVFNDYTSITGGFILALLMPASIPYGVIIIAAVLVTVIGKQAFGGNDNLIFNPVAVGYALVTLCWSKVMLMFPSPVPMGQLSLASQISETQSHSLTYFLNMGNIPFFYRLDILLGRFEGPMGTSHIIILFVCLFCFVLRKSASIFTVVSSLITLVVGAGLFPLAYNMSLKAAIIFEIISCSTIYVLLFLLCDHRITPKTRTGQSLYGMLFAILTLFLRRYIGLEIAAIFAVLFSNALVSTMDDLGILLIKLLKSTRRLIPQIVRLLLFLVITVAKLFKKLYLKITNKAAQSRSEDINKDDNKTNEESEGNVSEKTLEKSNVDVLAVENAKPKKNLKMPKTKQTIILEITDKTKHNDKSQEISEDVVKKIMVEKTSIMNSETTEKKSVELTQKNKQNSKKKRSPKIADNEKPVDKIIKVPVVEPTILDDKSTEEASKEINNGKVIETAFEQTVLIAEEKPSVPQSKKRNYKNRTSQKAKQKENKNEQITINEVKIENIEDKNDFKVKDDTDIVQEQRQKTTNNRKKTLNSDDTKASISKEKADSKNISSTKNKSNSKSNFKTHAGSEKGEK